MESDIPNFDLPVDYIVGEGYEIDLSKRYKNFPCRVRSGFFILCVKGVMQQQSMEIFIILVKTI